MMFITFKDGTCKDLICLNKITHIKNIGIPYTLGKSRHFICMEDCEQIEIDDICYNKLVDFLKKNCLIEV